MNEIQETEELLRRLKSYKRPNGTRIHYATLKLERLRAREQFLEPEKPKRPRVRVKRENPVQLFRAKPCPENRAFVLKAEVYDLTQAMVALEKLRSKPWP